MRIFLVGDARERARLRNELGNESLEIVGEFQTIAEARAAPFRADAILLTGDLENPGQQEDDDWMAEALTPREIEVLELLTEGLPNKAIAQRLAISDQTVKFHIASILGKLGVANRTEAVRQALRRGLISL